LSKHKKTAPKRPIFTCRYLDIPLRRWHFCKFVFKTLPVRPKYPAETTNFYWPPEVAVRPKHPKCKNEFVFRFSYFTFENEFVFLISLLKTKNEKGIRFSFTNLKTKNEFVIRFSFANLKTEKENTVYTRTKMAIKMATTSNQKVNNSNIFCIKLHRNVVLYVLMYMHWFQWNHYFAENIQRYNI